MRVKLLFCTLFTLLILVAVQSVSAHANLLMSVPAANAVLNAPPEEIRLWFTEPAEPRFSSFTLRDINGNTLDIATSAIDPQDATQLFMKIPLDTISDGVYTVAWQVVSAADGHPTRSNFSFTVGEANGLASASAIANETVPIDNALVRSLNLYTFALLIGVAGFWLFTLRPALADTKAPLVEAWLWRLIGVGWLALGVTGILMLLMQASLVANTTLLGAINSPALGQVIEESRYGVLWLSRMILWLLIGVAIVWPEPRWLRARLWVILLLGLGILFFQSDYSHSSAAQEATPSIASDWLHLLATSLWLGGLAAFIAIIQPIRRSVNPSAQALARLIGYFTNYARICVVTLVLTGLYAAWLHVGSLEGLTTTLYGRALLLKLLLFFPVVVLAAINMIYTHRGLERGRLDWIARFRGLLGVEIVLTIGVLIAVGIMTSIQPARTALASQQGTGLGSNTALAPFSDMYMSPDIHVMLDISPGWVGMNTFTVTLADLAGNWIPDASLVRLRMEPESANVGQSDLKLEHTVDGTYTARGANLNLPGLWNVRLSIRRPDAYDTVVDFKPQVSPMPEAADPAPPLTERLIALSAAGLALLIAGGYTLTQTSFRPLRGSALLALGLIFVGILMLISMAQLTG
ncbi:MAG: copper resistance protein CopC [Anaerolineae bacterium]|nr:copper resistance protein CopC [Anaerolineae bacterium]